LAFIVMAALAGISIAGPRGTQARWQLGDREPHAGMPFELILAVNGLEETPAVAQPKLEVPGAKVTPLGGEIHQSSMSIVVNGRQMGDVGVTWAFHWRVEVANAGSLHIPALTVTQGKTTATAAAANVDVDAVPTTDAMKLELQLPNRPVFVGETLDTKLVWLFRAKPQGQDFTLPIAGLDAFTVTQPPVPDPNRAIPFDINGKKLQFPYDADAVEVGGQKWTRVTIHMFVVPRVVGKVEVPPTTVSAALPYGQPDIFGRYDTKTMRTSDVAKTLEVKPLPETDRPASFAGAVGTQYSMKVEASRSVVQQGEPVELAITVKSDQRLDTLALGKLDTPDRLPKDKFTVPADPPTGELSDDGKTKTFKVTATVTGAATEIPALAFSYFDPAKNVYQTIHSDPIALSVKGGAVIGTNDVVAIAPKPGAPKPGVVADDDTVLVGAELALSAPSDTDTKPLSGALLAILLVLLYAVPLGVFALRSWQHRTRDQREDAAEVKAARRRVDTELARADKDPARDTAGALTAALRGLARALERDVDDDGLLARLETESFSRTAKDAPLPPELRQRARELADRWTRESRRATKPSVPKASVLVVLLLAAGAARASADTGSAAPRPAAASTSDASTLATGRDAYQQALGVTDASARKAAFTRAAVALGEAAQVTPDRPELLADWGNAALGAGDVGAATLAYRRALAIDPGNARAKQNLAWLRNRESPTLRPAGGGAADTLFFFHDWSRGRRLVVGAFAFACAVLLLVPWSGRRRRGLGLLAILPAIVWLAMVLSVLLEDRHMHDAVVMDAVVLRAADSAGAPAAMSTPLPRGTEVTIVENRETWAKLRIANGTLGWVPAGAIQRIIPEP
jgi:tetratricopeptide (TPR) repeat protein